MANLTRHNDPFRALTRFDPFREIESFLPSQMRQWMAETPAVPTIRVDVTEDDKAYHVKAELPGVKKEDISCEIEGHDVSISADVKRENEQKENGNVLHSERYYGTVYRSFSLPHEVDRDHCEAKLHDGVLELTLPKKTESGNKRITVQ